MNPQYYPSTLLYVPSKVGYCVHKLCDVDVLGDHADKDTVLLCTELWTCRSTAREKERHINTTGCAGHRWTTIFHAPSETV